MKTPATSRHFTAWTDPDSGAIQYLLNAPQVPATQSPYYTSPTYTRDGRFLWFHCVYPDPDGGTPSEHMGVVDFQTDDLHLYPDTTYVRTLCRPWVDLETGHLYFCRGTEIWSRGPLPDQTPALFNRLPDTLIHGRLHHMGTHPLFLADHSGFLLDIRFEHGDGSSTTHLGDMPRDGSPFRLWATLENRYFNHAIPSPVSPDRVLFAREYWHDHKNDPFDGTLKYHRMWWLDRGGEPRPVLPEPVSHSGHEWWDADGEHVWYLHYGVGIKRVRLETGDEELVWPGSLSHAYSDPSGRFLVADAMEDPGNADLQVYLRDLSTGKVRTLAKAAPPPSGTFRPPHLHPHPHFCGGGQWIGFTSWVRNKVEFALVFTGDETGAF